MISYVSIREERDAAGKDERSKNREPPLLSLVLTWVPSAPSTVPLSPMLFIHTGTYRLTYITKKNVVLLNLQLFFIFKVMLSNEFHKLWILTFVFDWSHYEGFWCSFRVKETKVGLQIIHSNQVSVFDVVFFFFFLALLEHLWDTVSSIAYPDWNMSANIWTFHLNHWGQIVIPSRCDIRSDDTSRWVWY